MDFSLNFPINDPVDAPQTKPVVEEVDSRVETTDSVDQAIDSFDADFDLSDFVAIESNSVLNCEEASDSFINAQPSMDAAQFDAAAFFSSQAPAAANDTDDTASVPEIVEESILTPDFLEEPKVDIIDEPLNAVMTEDPKMDAVNEPLDVGLIEEPLAETEELKVAVHESASLAEPADQSADSKVDEPVHESEPAPKKPRARRVEPPVAAASDAEEETGRRSTRVRSSVQRLADEQVAAASATATEFTIPSGLGVKLGDVADIAAMLGKKLSSDKAMVALHRLLYNRPGDAHLRKSHLRAFSGFPVENTQLAGKLAKLTLADLKAMAALLCLDTTAAKTKDHMVKRLNDFLQRPDASMVDTAKTAPSAAAKKTSPTKKRAAPAKKKATPAAAKKAKSAAKPSKDSREPLTPEIIDDSSDLDPDVEQEVLQEIAAESGQQA